MKIVVVNNFFPPRPGGSAHLSDHLARGYAAQGNHVLVITASYGTAPETESRDGFRIVRIPAWTLPKTRFAANFDIGFTFSIGTVRQVFDILDDFQPDVIHQHGQFFDLTWITGWWAKKHNVPTLLSIHTRLESPLSKFNSLIYALGDRLLVAPLMRIHKPHLVVMDVLMQRYIKKRYSRSISGTVAIPVGIDPNTLRNGDAAAARNLLGLTTEPIILSLGHVIPQRSRITLVKALPDILHKIPNAKVVVIGGVYHDEFMQIANQLGVADSIITIGMMPQKDIPDFLAAADLEVHELEGEGFGTASLEALAVGLPVVAAVRPDNFINVPLVDGRDLFIAPFVSRHDEKADPKSLAQVIVRVLEDPELAKKKVSDNAIRLIENHFTIERVTQQHLEVLTRLTPSPK